jgi:conjugative transfer signal peptidase TraF
MNFTAAQCSIFRSMALGFFLVLTAAIATPPYKLIYNPSESAPRGWYVFKRTDRIYLGDFVLAHLPDAIATFASERGYLPNNVSILKHVAAMPGQEVCRERDLLTIDGVLVAHTLERDGAGRALPRWSGCRTIAKGEVFLLSTDSPLSFDSRYFGPIARSAVIGQVLPLWTE